MQTIIQTPDAPHPQAQVQGINFEEGRIRFRWLDADGNAVDSGNSLATFTLGAGFPTEEEIAAAITASTA